MQCKEERYKEEKKVDRKEEDNKEERSKKEDAGKNDFNIWDVFNLAIGIAFLVGIIILGFSKYKEEAKLVTEKMATIGTVSVTKTVAAGAEAVIARADIEKNSYNTYFFGATGMEKTLQLKNDITQIYMSDDITEEKMKEYLEAYDNIINSGLSDSEIPPEAIEEYNNIIKEIPFINNDRYQLKSTGENFRRGLKGWLIADAYWLILDYYQKQIPEEKYNTFIIIARQNLYYYEEENCTRIIEYGKKLIEDYIGDPAEVLASTEWRTFTGMPER